MFVKNLPLEYDVEDIKKLFPNENDIQEVRIVTNKNGITLYNNLN